MYEEQEKYHNHDKVPDTFAYGSRCRVACMTADEEDGPHLCIRPRADPDRDTRLLRLGVIPPPWEQPSFARKTVTKTLGGNPTEYVLVWSGPTSEILDHVRVGRRQPLFSWLPASLPELWGLFLEYLSTINLSLFFFNLLPISILDGGVVLGVVLDMLESRFGRWKGTKGAEAYDIDLMVESGETRGGRTGRRRWRRPVEKGIGFGTMALGAFVLLGTLWRDLG
jgi:S2P endopeptidase